jgi:hypothetical protein
MEDNEHRDASQDGADIGGGVLSSLPRARPQRASPRRAAARKTAGQKSADAGRHATASQPATSRSKPAGGPSTPAEKQPTPSRRPRRGPRVAKPVEPPTPKQGYEPEDEVELGATVNPPSGGELVESVADIVTELAGAGLAAGGRLLKDALSLLGRP